MQEEDAQSNRDINFQIVKGERERRGQNAPDCLSVCGCLFERVCDTFTSSLLCHDYHHACSLSEQRSSCVPLVRLNCTAFYIITTSTLSALPTHGALHAVQCVTESKDLLSRTRLDHKVGMPAIFIHCSAVRPIRLLTAHAGPLVTFDSSVGCKHRSTVSEQNPHCGFIRCVGQLTTFFVHYFLKIVSVCELVVVVGL